MKINLNMNEINSVEKIISNVLVENDFNGMNKLLNKNCIENKFIFPSMDGNEKTSFVSIQKNYIKSYVQVVAEKEFLKIIGATKRGISKKSGRYQEYLYSNYLQAMKEQDEGYLSDVVKKALEFQSNVSYVKKLMKNKNFVKEWRKNFNEETALEVFKRKGNLRIVNIVKERAM